MNEQTRKSGVLAFLLIGLLFSAAPASAQNNRRPIPSDGYYAACKALGDGVPEAAAAILKEELSLATKVGPVRWLDSICYYAMYGETLYTLGDPAGALTAYESAIDLYLQNKDWLGRVNYAFSPTSKGKSAAPWGTGERLVPVGVFPVEATIVTGDVITKQRLQQGGMIANQEMRRIDPIAILHSMALAVRRRNELLGPLAPFDPRSAEIVNCFSTRAVTPNHWSVTWLDVLFGLSLQSVGKTAEAENILTKSLLMGGQFDHSLTASALLALGDGYLVSGKTSEAAVCFLEASVTAYQFGDSTEAAEGLEKYADTARMEHRQGSVDALENGLVWAMSARGAAAVRLVLLFETTENLLAAHRFPEARRRLDLAATQLHASKMLESRWADRENRLEALLFYAAGDSAAGDRLLHRALDGASEHSTRIFQTKMLGQFVLGGNDWNLTARSQCELYDILLRPSDAIDWEIYPLETLAFETMLGTEPFENWFVLLMDRNLPDQAFEIAERARQIRYFRTLPYGGRPSAIRYLLETPPVKLSDELRTIRQTLLDEYPAYAEPAKKGAELRSELAKLPILPGEKDDAHRALLAQSYAAAEACEAAIQFITADRTYVPVLFPPRFSVADLQASLPWDGTILAFFQARGDYYGFLMTPEIFEGWRVGTASAVSGRVATFLKSICVTDGNKAKQLKDLTNDAWKKNGRSLLNDLLGDAASQAARFRVQFKRLAVVPDGVLWYLPFEALCLPSGDNLIPLIQAPDLAVTYAPTAALTFGVGGERRENPFAETALVPGTLFPREKEEAQKGALERMEASLRKTVRLVPSGLNLPSSATAFRLDRLAVLNELNAAGGDWVPYATGKIAGDSIHRWEYLPTGAPQTIVLPGFRTSGESGLKERGNGSEIFVPLLTLMARGSRTILLSRWRTGGRSAYDLTESFLTNLDAGKEPAAAWRETLLTFFDKPLILEEEPRYRGSAKTDTLDGDTPFFWSGYMLVDGAFDFVNPAENQAEPNADDNALPAEGQDAEERDKDAATDKDADDKTPDDATDESDGTDEDATKESADRSETPDAQPAPAQKPAAPRPITDEEIERADEEADDFYAPTHQP